MEFLGQFKPEAHQSRLVSILISTLLHLAIFLIFVYLLKTNAPSNTLGPVIDVTFLELPESDILPDGKTNSEPPKTVSAPKNKKLVEPSESELKKMKKRQTKPKKKAEPKENQSSTENSSNDFIMKDGFLPGGKGKMSGSMALDSDNFPFLYYLSMMKNKISENWIPQFGAVTPDQPRRVVVHFRVDRKGNVISPEIEESSNDQSVDRSALRAVIISSPFPPLPDGYPDVTLGVHFGFKCEI